VTTIAYKAGVIAYDSRVRRGDLIVTDSADKCRVEKGVRFFLTGYVSDEDELVAAYFGEGEISDGNSCAAFVVDGDKVLLIGAEDGEMYKQPVHSAGDAIGSGTPFALAAMDMGADAERAVEIAAGRDSATGGHIRCFLCPKKP